MVHGKSKGGGFGGGSQDIDLIGMLEYRTQNRHNISFGSKICGRDIE